MFIAVWNITLKAKHHLRVRSDDVDNLLEPLYKWKYFVRVSNSRYLCIFHDFIHFFFKIFEDDFVENELRCSRSALHDPCCCQLFGTNSIQKVEVSLIFWDVVFFKMALAIFNTKKEKTSWSQPELMVHAILDLRQVLVGYKFFSFMVLKHTAIQWSHISYLIVKSMPVRQ